MVQRIVAGGYPPALARPAGRRRANWYRNYIDAQVQRDVGSLSRISGLDALPRLLSMAATQTAQLFNLSRLAAPFQLSRPTIGDYIALLERVYLLERLPPWHSNLGKRLVKTPKLHIGDTGLVCALLGASVQTLQADRTLLGQLLETFVFQELRRQATWYAGPVDFFHYRDKDQVEVDIVMEYGSLVAGCRGQDRRDGHFIRLPRTAQAQGGQRGTLCLRGGALRRRNYRELWERPACRPRAPAMGNAINISLALAVGVAIPAIRALAGSTPCCPPRPSSSPR